MEAQIDQGTKGSGNQAVGINSGQVIKIEGEDSPVFAIGTLTSHNNQTLHLELNIQPAQTTKPMDEVAKVHEAWRLEHERDAEFVRETRIAATGPERVALQRLLCMGAKTKQIKELWQCGLLRHEAGKLATRRPRFYPIFGIVAGSVVWVGAAFYLGMFLVAKPRSTAEIAGFLMFVSMTILGVHAAWSMIRPWLAVERIRPLVSNCNQGGGQS